MTILNTKRLVLKAINESSLPIYQQILGSDELSQYLPKGKAYTTDEIQNHVASRIEHWQHGFGSYGIYDRQQSDVIIGYVGVEYCPDPQYSDIRYGMSQTGQGRGFVKEASLAVLAQTFKLGLHNKIYGVSILDNLASIAILKKLGMSIEPNVHPYGQVDRLITFSISKNAY